VKEAELQYRYPLTLTPDDDGTVLVSSPDFPELNTYGTDQADALRMARGALEACVQMYVELGKPMPKPSPARGRPTISPRPTTALKLAVRDSMREAGIGPAALARLMGVDRKLVARILDPAHRSTLKQLEAALAALGREVDIEVRAA